MHPWCPAGYHTGITEHPPGWPAASLRPRLSRGGGRQAPPRNGAACEAGVMPGGVNLRVAGRGARPRGGTPLGEHVNVVEASGLGKRYGSTWALRECTLAIPAGHVTALVGPNGAGKSTLLNLAVGLTAPSAGEVTVLGGRLPGAPGALDGIAFVAQDTPLYKTLSVADMLHLTRNLTRRFDQAYAEARLSELGIPLKRKAGKLSGGQQAQVALTLALARRPALLVLDEPVAMLDPIARHDFMATVLAAASADGVSVLLSSHVLTELERVTSYLILLSAGQVRLVGAVGDLLAAHHQASLEELALTYLRDNPTEVAK